MSFTDLGIGASLRQLGGTSDGTKVTTAAAIFQNDMLVVPLSAGEFWQGEPCDMTGVDSGVAGGYVAFSASLLTDVAGSSLFIDVSSTGIEWARVAVVTVAATVSTTINTTGMASTTGLTTVPAASTVGFLPGDKIVLGSGSTSANIETLTIAADGVGATTLTTTSGSLHTHANGVKLEGLYVATAEYQTRGFRYARCAGVNGPVLTTVNTIASQAKASA